MYRILFIKNQIYENNTRVRECGIWHGRRYGKEYRTGVITTGMGWLQNSQKALWVVGVVEAAAVARSS